MRSIAQAIVCVAFLALGALAFERGYQEAAVVLFMVGGLFASMTMMD